MASDLDTILLTVFGTLGGIFGLLFLMAALEPPRITPPAATRQRATAGAAQSVE